VIGARRREPKTLERPIHLDGFTGCTLHTTATRLVFADSKTGAHDIHLRRWIARGYRNLQFVGRSGSCSTA
jgi:hypothetical protein